jgi:hypothetical protein
VDNSTQLFATTLYRLYGKWHAFAEQVIHNEYICFEAFCFTAVAKVLYGNSFFSKRTEISGSHGDEPESGCPLDFCAV